MKINFGIEEFKLLKDLKSFEENIYSNGESFIIYDYNKNIVLIETLTDLLDYFNINDNREDVIYKIIYEEMSKHMIAEGRNIPAQPDTKQMKKDQVTRYIKDKGDVNSYDKKG